MRIDHVAIWTNDLERLKEFYRDRLGGQPGEKYQNHAKGLETYFLRFGDGARLEIMRRPEVGLREGAGDYPRGYAHLALSVDNPQAVDAAVARLKAAGVVVQGEPRWTGDGYYEAVVLDPDGNRIELVAERRA
ncbi:MAG TPA: VOC family protein [Spirochaetia bacterium]|nr:VOC family protein [Spirochaetales bacterium]HRY72649.1 VOC family protein [Spirochaetia bacterium]